MVLVVVAVVVVVGAAAAVVVVVVVVAAAAANLRTMYIVINPQCQLQMAALLRGNNVIQDHVIMQTLLLKRMGNKKVQLISGIKGEVEHEQTQILSRTYACTASPIAMTISCRRDELKHK